MESVVRGQRQRVLPFRLQRQHVLQPPRDERAALQHNDGVHPRREAGRVSFVGRIRDRYLQIGKWRFGDADGRHFTVVHDGGKTVQVYTKDGKRLGADSNVTVRHRDEEAPEEIKFGDRFVQIGNFRICDVDGTHASICMVDGKTSQIFRKDGTLHPGPRDDFCCHQRSVDPRTRTPHDRRPVIQIGEWRLGAIDTTTSMSHKDGKTAQIYRNDGTLHGTSGRTDGCYG